MKKMPTKFKPFKFSIFLFFIIQWNYSHSQINLSKMNITVTHIDGPCILLEINGFKIITDPTLDSAGKIYHHGFGSISRKTDNPVLNDSTLKNIDLILLSHHQHKDNFDNKGREFAKTVPLILTTKNGSKKLSNAVGLNNWESFAINTPKLKGLKITAIPAQHHPSWLPAFFSGKVIGFIIEYEGQEHGVIYISGDTVFFDEFYEIAKRYKIDISIFHVGSAQFPYLSGKGRYTMDSNDLIKAVEVLKPNKVIPIHHKGWSHFKEKEDTMKTNRSNNEFTKEKTIFLVSGKPDKL
jgi:L-ascorbate metabolism protein UlaG (beta-lactamase superfamily)